MRSDFIFESSIKLINIPVHSCNMSKIIFILQPNGLYLNTSNSTFVLPISTNFLPNAIVLSFNLLPKAIAFVLNDENLLIVPTQADAQSLPVFCNLSFRDGDIALSAF